LGNFLELANCNLFLFKQIKAPKWPFGLFVKGCGGGGHSGRLSIIVCKALFLILKSVKLYFSSGALNSGELI
jgi:hypothetical protein